MALIKCKECNKEISDKAVSCPHCGFPLNNNSKLTTVEITSEKINIKKALILFAISFMILILMLADLKYANSYNKIYSFTRILTYNFREYILIILLFGILVLVGYFMKIITRYSSKISKYLYYASLLIFVIYNFSIYNNGYKLGLIYPIIYLCIILLIIIKSDTKIVEEKIEVREEIAKDIKEDNKKRVERLKKEENKKENKIFLVINIILIIIGVVTSIVFMSNSALVNAPLSSITSMKQVEEGKRIFVTVTNDYINVRKESTSGSKKIGKVLKDETYEIIDIETHSNTKWYKIIDKEGYSGFIINKDGKYVDLFSEDTIELSIIHDKEQKIIEELKTTTTKTTTSRRINKKETTKQDNNSKTTTKKGENKTTTVTTSSNKTTTTTKTTTQKKDCSNQIEARRRKYESDRVALENDYDSRARNAKNKVDNAKLNMNSYGGYISYSSYRSQMNSLESQLNTAQTNLQRASMDSSGASSSKVIRYRNEITTILNKEAELKRRYDYSAIYDDAVETYNEILTDEKYALQDLYNKFSKDLDNISENCN